MGLSEVVELTEQEYEELKAKTKTFNNIFSCRKLSQKLVRIVVLATDDRLFDKLFHDEEFKSYWFAMLRRLDEIEEDNEETS